MESLKICSWCKTQKPCAEFPSEPRNRDGLSGWCRICKNRYACDLRHGIHKRQPIAVRFWRRVDMLTPEECWLWGGSIARGGYGRTKRGKRSVSAHRLAWELANGPIPEGLDILHRCDNPPCVNPAHLVPGTHRENMRDMLRKGRRNMPAGEAHHNAVITNEQARIIRALVAGGMRQADVARRLNLAKDLVNRIAKGRSYKNA